MRKNNNKHPNRKIDPITRKCPTGGEKVNGIPRKFFKWSTEQADHEGEFGWSNADTLILFRDIIPKLQKFESMKWGEIEGRRNHFVSTDVICKEAMDRLSAIGQGDEENIFSLHLDGTGRVWGLRYDNVLKLLWWDPEHKICPSKLKHT